jgi:hypothetical protein
MPTLRDLARELTDADVVDRFATSITNRESPNDQRVYRDEIVRRIRATRLTTRMHASIGCLASLAGCAIAALAGGLLLGLAARAFAWAAGAEG